MASVAAHAAILAWLVLSLLACGTSGQVPQRPKLPRTFTSQYKAEIAFKDSSGQLTVNSGDGYRYYSEATKQAVTNTTFYLEGGAFERHFNLRLYIIGKQYQYVWDSTTKLNCSGSALNGSFEGFWDWVEEATYSGKRDYNGTTLDFWMSENGGVTNEVGVFPEITDKPVVLFITHNGQSYRRATTSFTSFSPFPPPESSFIVPTECRV